MLNVPLTVYFSMFVTGLKPEIFSKAYYLSLRTFLMINSPVSVQLFTKMPAFQCPLTVLSAILDYAFSTREGRSLPTEIFSRDPNLLIKAKKHLPPEFARLFWLATGLYMKFLLQNTYTTSNNIKKKRTQTVQGIPNWHPDHCDNKHM